MGRIVVQKYGGSSVADVPRIQAIAERVARTVKSGTQVVVVVSAMGNTTNELLELARTVSPDPGRRELDLLVSVGERVSMTLLAIAIEGLGVPAASFTGSQAGIITDERHVAAQVIEVRPWRIQRALSQGLVAIVAGFQGVSRHGEVTTLGRGGSDTTAVVLAAALGAVHCEICSDVDGVYSADPRVVPGAQRLDSVPLDAAIALSTAGTKVLLADAVLRARELGVALMATATTHAPGSGTALPPGAAPGDVIAVAADTQLAQVVVRGDPSSLRTATGAVRAWWTDGPDQHALIDMRNIHGDAHLEDIPNVISVTPVAALTAVGGAAVDSPTVVEACVRALQPLGLLRWWATGTAWTGLVPRAAAEAGQRALHDATVAAPAGQNS
jgi:aspartate kinase